MTVTTIDLYNILKSKIGENEAKTLVEFVELRVEKQIEEQMEEIAGKKDLFQVKSELELKIEKVRSDLIKWMFIFWVGQVSVTVALILLLTR
ncbi:MAG: hypothetical protein ISS17_03595 [Bacteroidales bacterium]|nr:hypothetical protein [Bacteroidales bacterium]